MEDQTLQLAAEAPAEETAAGCPCRHKHRELLSNHIHTCVVQDIQNGHLEVVDDLLVTIQKLMK